MLFCLLRHSDTHGIWNSPTAAVVVDTCLGTVAPLAALPVLIDVFSLDTVVVGKSLSSPVV